MTKVINLTLPWPPSVNNYWGDRVIAGKGRKPFVQKYIKPKARAFREEVATIIKERWPNLKPIDRKVALVITAVMPDRRKRDLDNLLKATKDSLTHAGFWVDDSLVDVVVVVRGPVEKGGRLEVFVIDGGENQFDVSSFVEQLG